MKKRGRKQKVKKKNPYFNKLELLIVVITILFSAFGLLLLASQGNFNNAIGNVITGFSEFSIYPEEKVEIQPIEETTNETYSIPIEDEETATTEESDAQFSVQPIENLSVQIGEDAGFGIMPIENLTLTENITITKENITVELEPEISLAGFEPVKYCIDTGKGRKTISPMEVRGKCVTQTKIDMLFPCMLQPDLTIVCELNKELVLEIEKAGYDVSGFTQDTFGTDESDFGISEHAEIPGLRIIEVKDKSEFSGDASGLSSGLDYLKMQDGSQIWELKQVSEKEQFVGQFGILPTGENIRAGGFWNTAKGKKVALDAVRASRDGIPVSGPAGGDGVDGVIEVSKLGIGVGGGCKGKLVVLEIDISQKGTVLMNYLAGTSIWEITDFYYGTGYNVSIDTNVTLTNVHAKEYLDHYPVNESYMVGYYKLEGDATDSSPQGNDGSITGATAEEGYVDQAYNFNGSSDYIEISHDASLNVSTIKEITISAWVKKKDTTADAIITKSDDGHYADIHYILDTGLLSAGKFCFYMGNDTTYKYSCGTTSYAINTWYHVVGQLNGTDLLVYVNGQQEGTPNTLESSFLNTLYDEGESLWIGSNGATSSFFNGTIDEVMIFNTSLSAAEISEIYNYGHSEVLRMEMTDNADDSSIGNSGNDGIVKGATHVHEHYYFDGVDDKIVIANVPTTSRTMALWFKPKDIVGFQGLVGTDGINWYRLTILSSNLELKLHNGTDAKTIQTPITQNDIWYHAGGTYDLTTGNLSLYLNGDIKSSDILSSASTSASSSISTVFNGSIDEVLIYNRSLTSTEISDLYNDGLYHTVSDGDAYIDSGVLDLASYNRIREIYFTCNNNSHTNCSLSYKTGNYTGVDITDANLVSYWNLSRAHVSYDEDNLVGYWQMEGNAEDDSYVGDNDGTISGDVHNVDGFVRQGMEFDKANDFINISYDSSFAFNLTDTYCVAAWIKAPTTGAQAIVSTYDSGGYPFELSFEANDYVRFAISNSSGANYSETSTDYSDDTWHHVVGCKNSTSTAVFVDGSLKDSDTYTNSGTIGNERNILVGARPDASLDYNGTIDEVMIFNRSLSSTEITELYQLQAGLYDSADAGDNHGEVHNQTMADGYFENDAAMNLDGVDDYIEVTDVDNLDYNSTQPKTVSVWFNFNDVLGVQTVVSKYGDSDEREWILYTSGTTLYLGVNAEATEVSKTISANQWYHAVFTLDTSGNSELFINGASEGTGSASSFRTSPTEPLRFGQNADTNYFNGTIDSVAIYNRSLSASEIQELYNTKGTWTTKDYSSPVSIYHDNNTLQYRVYLESEFTNMTATLTNVTVVYDNNTAPTQNIPLSGSHYPVNNSYMVGYWTFDETSYSDWAVDSSPQSNNGTVTSATHTKEGRVGNAYEFGPGADITISTALGLPSNNITVSVWVNYESSIAAWSTLVSHDITSVGGWRLFTRPFSDTCYFGVHNGTAMQLATASGKMTENIWHHLVGTANTTSISIYVDGVLEKSVSVSNITTLDTSGDIVFQSGVPGYLDEVMIYNTSLTSSEIQNIYNSTRGAFDSDVDTGIKTNFDIAASPNGTADNDSDVLTYIYNWWYNTSSTADYIPLAVLNMPFEANDTSSYTSVVKDYSGYGNDGTVTGATYDSNSGYDGFGAYDFDGTDDTIMIGTDTNLNFTDEMTISTWFKFDVLNDASYTTIISDAKQIDLLLSPSEKIYIDMWNITSNSQKNIQSTTTLQINTWYHAAVTYDSSTSDNMKLYLNGLQESSNNLTNGLSARAYNWSIGKQGSAFTKFWNGTIDEVMIYNTSLTAEQILALYQNKTNTILQEETNKNEHWKAEITTCDNNYECTSSKNTSFLKIENTKPTIIPTIGSHYPINYSDQRAYWRFDADSTDSSGRGYTLTNRGATHSSEGRVGSAYEFNSTGSFMITSTAAVFSQEEELTWVAWIKTPLKFIGSYGVPCCKRGNWDIRVYPTGNIILCLSTQQSSWHCASSANGVITANTWKHVAITYSNYTDTVVYYIDGNAVVTDTTTTKGYINANSYFIHIGTVGTNTVPDNLYFNGTIDEVMIYNTSLTATRIADIYNSTRGQYDVFTTYDIGCGLNTSDIDQDNRSLYQTIWYNNSIPETALENNSDILAEKTSSGDTWLCEVRAFDGEDWSPKGNSSLTIANKPPTAETITWITTGGFTDNTLSYNQKMHEINITVSDTDEDTNSVKLFVYDPDGTVIVNNISMSNTTSDVWNYSSQFKFTKSGIWTINITADDTINTTVNSTWFNVSTNALSLADGWYGYTNETVLSAGEIADLTNYEFDIFEFKQNASGIVGNWTTIKNAIYNASDQNIKVGLNILLDLNYSNASQAEEVKVDLNNTLNDTDLDPYSITLEYISLELIEDSLYGDADLNNTLNDIAETVTYAIDNRFVVYSKSYNNTDLDQAYIIATLLHYPNPTTQPGFINQEANLLRANKSISRIYTKINFTIMGHAYTYQKNIIDQLRGTINYTTTIADDKIAEILTNGTRDIVVFNNQSTSRLIPVNFSEISYTVTGKDAWDMTNKLLVEENSDLNFSANVSDFSATMILLEDLDHIQMDDNNTALVYKGASSSTINHNYTNGTRVSSWSITGDNDIKIELFDPHYKLNNFITYYGWLNTTYINHPTEWENYEIVILGDHNQVELAKLNYTPTEFYVYIGVDDYDTNAQDSWYSNKTTEVNDWLALNESLHIFIDGLDTGIGGSNFSSRMKDLVNYVQITKDRKAILNTYTAYEDFATWGEGGVMKESCVNRWNGVNSTNVGNYTRETWGLELNKSKWYQKHNVKVLCQAFNNQSGNNLYYPTNYTDLENVYFASLVLGYDYFFLSDPLFNYVPTEYIYDAGTDLAKEYNTNDNETYYRRYSNGIVYYNSTSEQGWIEAGRKINDVKVCFELYDNSATEGDSWNFVINKDGDSTQYGDYWINDSSTGDFTWEWHCVKINETDYLNSHGRYIIEAWNMPRASGNGFSFGNTLLTGDGKHSWYDTSATDSWTVYAVEQNWQVNITVNETISTSVDSFSLIQQNTTGDHQRRNISLTSGNTYNFTTWSLPITITGEKFTFFKIWNGTVFIDLNYNNVSDCDSADPDWATTIETGVTWESCIYDNTTDVTYRFAGPIKSDLIAQAGSNNEPSQAGPLVGAHYPVNNSYMVGYWTFDETSYSDWAVDLSPQSNNGTVTGATHTFEGRVGSAYEFDGVGDKIVIANVPTTSRTLSLWFKPKDIVGFQGLVGTDGTDWCRLTILSSNLELRLYNGTDAKTIQTPITQNDIWYHAGGTYDLTTGNLSLYLNGDIKSSDILSSASTTASSSISTVFNGTIDEVIIYNRSLTDLEIQDIYNSTRGVKGVDETFDITAAPNGTADNDSDSLTYIYNWWVKTTADSDHMPIAVLNMPFESNDSNNNVTKDYSSYGNDGAVTGATFAAKEGYDGFGAYQFDGASDYINLGQPDSLNVTDLNFTISVWFKTSDKQAWRTMIGPNENCYNLRFSSTTGKPVLTIGGDNGATADSDQADGNWHHVVSGWNGTNSYIFIDSVLQTGVGTTAPIGIWCDTDIIIGTLATLYFNGTMDDLKIYGRSLSEEQILALYQNKTNTIVNEEIAKLDSWKATVTTCDGYECTSEQNITALDAETDYPIIYTTPTDATIQTDEGSTSFKFNVTDNDIVVNCSLIIDSAVAAQNTTAVNETDTNTIDYLISANGDYLWWINCTDELAYTNKSVTKTLTIARSRPAAPAGTGSGSGAGSAGGASSTISDISQTEYGNIFAIPSLITPITIKPTRLTDYIESITIYPAGETSNVKITIEELPNIQIPKPDTNIIKFLKITAENLPRGALYKAVINFKVPKSEIINDILEMLHYENNQWIKLPTKLLKSDDVYNYYEATTTSLSYFVITTSKQTYQEKVATTIFPELKQKLGELTRLTNKDILLYAVLPLAIFGLIILLIIRFIYKKTKAHKTLRRFIFLGIPLIIIGLFIPLEKDILLYAILPLAVITLILYIIIHSIIKFIKKPKKTSKKKK